MSSMKNVQFLHPLPPFSVCPNGSEMAKTPPPPSAPGRRNLGYQPPLSPLVFLQHIDYI